MCTMPWFGYDIKKTALLVLLKVFLLVQKQTTFIIIKEEMYTVRFLLE